MQLLFLTSFAQESMETVGRRPPMTVLSSPLTLTHTLKVTFEHFSRLSSSSEEDREKIHSMTQWMQIVFDNRGRDSERLSSLSIDFH